MASREFSSPRTRGTLILASRSPRRAALLLDAGLAFEQRLFPDVDETPPVGVSVPEAARRLAMRKAMAVRGPPADATLLAADTLVFVDGEILGKPADPADAIRMLRRLSGSHHGVATGVCVRRGERTVSGVDVTFVTFRALHASEVEAYVATGEPLDKAGAYGIQGGAAGFVASREGALDTVIGLPIALVRRLLGEVGHPGGGA